MSWAHGSDIDSQSIGLDPEGFISCRGTLAWLSLQFISRSSPCHLTSSRDSRQTTFFFFLALLHTLYLLPILHRLFQSTPKAERIYQGPPTVTVTMKILFISTAHNSLSQRLYLSLSQLHAVTVEYALSDDAMREAVHLAKPDLIICPFLTSRVPNDIYEQHLTLIIHPGPPGDAGPSSLDWVLMGDDGTESDAGQLLQKHTLSEEGRPYWGVTVLQAEDEFDAGPVWAYEQFPINIDEPGLTKSGLYRGAVTRAAVSACLAAVDRINAAAYTSAPLTPPLTPQSSGCPSPVYRAIHPGLNANPQFKELSVGLHKPFMGGPTHHRPLLKAGQRDFNINTNNAKEISRRIRCSDSQPGCLSSVLGQNMYLYGGAVEETAWVAASTSVPGAIVAVRDEAVCIKTTDKRGIWITHIRRVKKKTDAKLWPKVPAVSGLCDLGLLSSEAVTKLSKPYATQKWVKSPHSTYQDIWVDFNIIDGNTDSATRVAYVHSEFYNGAMSTSQCEKLIEALDFVVSTHTIQRPLAAVVMMGGSGYFSNGIHLNVIEAATDPALESWNNINRINDVVYYLLHEFPSRNILTFAALRGNAAAGGVAMATAADCVISGVEVVLNPAYRALGLYGSEYHSISYNGRCGAGGARRLLRDMTPISAYEARSMGVVDHVLPGHGELLDARIRNHVKAVVRSIGLGRKGATRYMPGAWKAHADLTPKGLTRARAMELGEMSQDFWSPRAVRYHTRRGAFVRKMKATSTPLRFAKHRRTISGHEAPKLDEEETDNFDSAEYFAQQMAKSQEVNLTKEVLSKMKLSSDSEIGVAITNDVPTEPSGQGPVFACYYGA